MRGVSARIAKVIAKAIATGMVGLALALPVQAAEERCLSLDPVPGDDVRAVKVTTTTGEGPPAILHLQTFGRRSSTSRRVLVRFSHPRELRDSSLLIVDDAGPPRLWLSSPELDGVRELSAEVNTRLLGTYFGWEDVVLAQGLVGWDSAKALRRERLGEHDTLVVDMQPKPGTSHYARVRAWLDLESCIPLKLELFDTATHLRRVVENRPSSILQLGGRAIPHETSIRDLQAGTESRSVLQAIIPGLKVPDEILQAESLGQYQPRVLLDGDDGRPMVDPGRVSPEDAR